MVAVLRSLGNDGDDCVTYRSLELSQKHSKSYEIIQGYQITVENRIPMILEFDNNETIDSTMMGISIKLPFNEREVQKISYNTGVRSSELTYQIFSLPIAHEQLGRRVKLEAFHYTLTNDFTFKPYMSYSFCIYPWLLAEQGCFEYFHTPNMRSDDFTYYFDEDFVVPYDQDMIALVVNEFNHRDTDEPYVSKSARVKLLDTFPINTTESKFFRTSICGSHGCWDIHIGFMDERTEDEIQECEVDIKITRSSVAQVSDNVSVSIPIIRNIFYPYEDNLMRNDDNYNKHIVVNHRLVVYLLLRVNGAKYTDSFCVLANKTAIEKTGSYRKVIPEKTSYKINVSSRCLYHKEKIDYNPKSIFRDIKTASKTAIFV